MLWTQIGVRLLIFYLYRSTPRISCIFLITLLRSATCNSNIAVFLDLFIFIYISISIFVFFKPFARYIIAYQLEPLTFSRRILKYLDYVLYDENQCSCFFPLNPSYSYFEKHGSLQALPAISIFSRVIQGNFDRGRAFSGIPSCSGIPTNIAASSAYRYLK